MLEILYRELHYQIAKRNPLVANDEKQFQKAIKNAMNIKRSIGVQVLGFLPFGLLMASTFAFTNEKLVLSSLMVSLALIPFVFAMYVTAVQTSYILSVGLFEPLKLLPLKMGSRYLSGLLLLEISPSLAAVLPSALFLMVKYPLSGLFAVLWLLLGLFLGHTLGLLLVNFFSLRIHQRAGKGHSLKSFARVVMFLLFIGMFMMMNYLQYYIRKHSEQVAGIVEKYFIAYPFVVSSIFDPLRSMALFLAYLSIFGLVYHLTLKGVWKKILEPPVVSERRGVSKFKASPKGKVLALVLKDFKIFVRKPAMLVAFLFPIYVISPTLVSALQRGNLGLEDLLPVLFMIGLFSVPGADAVLKVEGKNLDFLKTLPVKKRDFVIAKVMSMALIPTFLGLSLVTLGVFYDSGAFVLLPYALFLPFIASSITMLYFFRYKGEEIGIPELRWPQIILMFIIVGMVFGIIILPIFVSFNVIGSEVIALVTSLTLAFLLGRLSR
ncbi:hypothetical protein ADU37_CDS15020 [Thermococcus sp. 2319x1]|uniref:hypothetical protein n=1 Tax=Thermococcus sp. 2319x1 TaxID=1674923 RepID=UPI00073A98E0|nr:hypothetical protein [Thermococcus sp. 2319x1]ALV63201.1 hypothetical protein ADU37_CDS15020 [Thermococcus sp. 2319x1]